MKLSEFYKKSLEEALKQMDLVDLKVHCDGTGDIKAVEIKYAPMPNDKAVSPKQDNTYSNTAFERRMIRNDN